MSGYNKASQYKEMSIKTATRGQILIMLYEAAIRNVKKASEALDKGDAAAKGAHIVKTHDIVNELINSLNHEIGGNIARDLERLYNFMAEQLLKANMENNKECLLTVQRMLETLLSGWRGAVEQVQKASAKK